LAALLGTVFIADEMITWQGALLDAALLTLVLAAPLGWWLRHAASIAALPHRGEDHPGASKPLNLLRVRVALYGIVLVMVTAGGKGHIAILSVFSAATYRPADLPPHLGDFLLLRNKEAMFAAWALTDLEGQVGFVASYTALVDGLDAGTFKLVCETLVKEVSAVDGGLRATGLL
jgi:hypothetical protein